MEREYKLKGPVEVMSDSKGEFEQSDLLVLKVSGFAMNKMLKGMQDTLFKSFMEATRKNTGSSETSETKDTDITKEMMLAILEMDGKAEEMFGLAFDLVKRCGTIGEQKVNDTLIDALHEDDYDGIYEMVVKDFLSKKVIMRLNSMSK